MAQTEARKENLQLGKGMDHSGVALLLRAGAMPSCGKTRFLLDRVSKISRQVSLEIIFIGHNMGIWLFLSSLKSSWTATNVFFRV